MRSCVGETIDIYFSADVETDGAIPGPWYFVRFAQGRLTFGHSRVAVPGHGDDPQLCP